LSGVSIHRKAGVESIASSKRSSCDLTPAESGAGRPAAVEQPEAHHRLQPRAGQRDAVAVALDLGGAYAQQPGRFEHGVRCRQLDSPGLLGDRALQGQPLRRLAADPTQADRVRCQRRRHRLPGRLGHRPRQVIGLAVGVTPEHLREQRVGGDGVVGPQSHARHRPCVELVGVEHPLREQRDLGPLSTLSRRQVQQFEKGAVAHHDLARERVGLGQQARQVAAQLDLAFAAQVHQPGLQVVRVRRQDRVRQHPASQVGLGARAGPGRQGGCRNSAVTCAQRGGGGQDGTAPEQADEGTTMHGIAPGCEKEVTAR
jgi:hypothetical protein